MLNLFSNLLRFIIPKNLSYGLIMKFRTRTKIFGKGFSRNNATPKNSKLSTYKTDSNLQTTEY